LSVTEAGKDLVQKEISKLYSLLVSRISELGGELPLPVTRGADKTEFIIVEGPSAGKKKLKLGFFAEDFRYRATEMTLNWRICLEENFYDSSAKSGPNYSPFFKENRQVVWKSGREVYSSEQVVTEALIKFAESINDLFKDFQIDAPRICDPKRLTRKVIQIAATNTEGHSSGDMVYALCDDGAVLFIRFAKGFSHWSEAPEIPRK
jgi:hypothetical protein